MNITKFHSAIIFLLLFQTTFLFGQKKSIVKDDTTVCLQIIGLAVEGDSPIDGVIVKLYKENEETHWEEITSVVYHEHSFSFDLNKNNYYTVEISKQGYVTRSIGIATALPDNVIIGGVKFTFEFDVELFKEKKNANDYYLDFPVAIIKYNETTGVFEYEAKYTKHIKAKINETSGATSSKGISTK